MARRVAASNHENRRPILSGLMRQGRVDRHLALLCLLEDVAEDEVAYVRCPERAALDEVR